MDGQVVHAAIVDDIEHGLHLVGGHPARIVEVEAQLIRADIRALLTGALAKDVLPRVGYKERAHLMNPMVPGLQGGKMSASDPDSKIDVLDTPDAVRRKLKSLA